MRAACWPLGVDSGASRGFSGCNAVRRQCVELLVVAAADRLSCLCGVSLCVGAMLQAMRAFRLAGLVDDRGVWSGGDTVCVQV